MGWLPAIAGTAPPHLPLRVRITPSPPYAVHGVNGKHSQHRNGETKGYTLPLERDLFSVKLRLRRKDRRRARTRVSRDAVRSRLPDGPEWHGLAPSTSRRGVRLALVTNLELRRPGLVFWECSFWQLRRELAAPHPGTGISRLHVGRPAERAPSIGHSAEQND